MSDKNKKEPQIMTFEGKEYNLEEFNQDQIKYVNMVADCERKIQSMRFNLEQITLGCEAWSAKLRKSLENAETIEKVVAE